MNSFEGEQMSTDRDCGGDAGAYVLGALKPAEAEAFARHLADCTICQDEVTTFTQVVHELPMSARQLPAPRGLRRRVLREVRRQPQPRRRARVRGPSLQLPVRYPVVRATAAAALLAACAALAIVLLTGSNGQPHGRVIRASVLGSPGSAQLRVSQGKAELAVSHFPAPPPGHVYEVWLQRADRTLAPANALFSVTKSGSAEVGLSTSLRGVKAILVTAEPDGGSRSPTSKPIVVAQTS